MADKSKLLYVLDNEFQILESTYSFVSRKLGLESSVKFFAETKDMLPEYKRDIEKGREVSLIVQDLMRMGMGPIETIDATRSINPEQKFMIMSGSSGGGRYYEELKEKDVEAFLRKPIRPSSLADRLANYMISNEDFNPDLYAGLSIILAPSGFGKSTVMKELTDAGAKFLPKYTTRSYRSKEEANSGEIVSVDRMTFRTLAKDSGMIGVSEYEGNFYGFRTADLEASVFDESPYVTGLIDPEPAIEIKQQYLGRTRLIALLPSKDLLGLGLTKRKEIITDLQSVPVDISERVMGRLDFDATLLDTKGRYETVAQDYERILQAAPYLDHIATESNLNKMTEQIMRFVYNE